jgi:hypothetical protein
MSQPAQYSGWHVVVGVEGAGRDVGCADAEAHQVHPDPPGGIHEALRHPLARLLASRRPRSLEPDKRRQQRGEDCLSHAALTVV